MAGRGTIRLMTGIHGTPKGQRRLLMQFHDSSDLYAFDPDARTWTLLFDAMTIPALTDRSLRLLWSAEHPVRGYLYVLAREPQGPGMNVVLEDTDRDGHLDTWHYIKDKASWNATFGPVETWTRVFE